MRRSDPPIDLQDIELARQIVRRDPSFHDTPHHPYEGAEAPAGIGRVCRGFCLQLTPVPSCDVEPTLELMTLRLAELVNASGNPQAETSNKVLIAQRGRERPKLCCYVLGVLSSRRGDHTYRRSFAPRCDRCAHTGTERLVHVQVTGVRYV